MKILLLRKTIFQPCFVHQTYSVQCRINEDSSLVPFHIYSFHQCCWEYKLDIVSLVSPERAVIDRGNPNATRTRSLKALLSIVTQHFLLSNLCDFFSWIFLTQHFLLSSLCDATFWSNKKHSGPIKALGVALCFLLDQNVWKVQINNLFKDRISWWMGWDILWVLAIGVATRHRTVKF